MQSTARGWQSRRTRRRVGAWTSHALLLVGAVVMVIPFVWMVSTSFKAARSKTFVYPPSGSRTHLSGRTIPTCGRRCP
ncbi:MAG: hypothetical protein R3A10_00625 [Caldilineaceae bacterium]